MEDIPVNKINIEINSPEFYEHVETEIDSDLARMKKAVEIMLNLRLMTAEVEVETAALYHADLWYDLLNIQNISGNNIEEEVIREEDKSDKKDL